MESGRFVPGVGTGLPEEEDVKRVILIIILIVSILSVGYSVYKLSRPDPEAFMRQEKEENIADQFLEDVKNRTDSKPGIAARKIGKASKAQIFLEEGNDPAMQEMLYAEFEDENYYMRDGRTYTPDYARGYLQCVLEIPDEDVQIRRGVYSGTAEDIAYDLDIWMVTAARPDYVLGKTHYVIYGHNHTVQNLSFNRLRNTQVGDEFFLTDENGKYTYEVTCILKMTREDVTYRLADNFNLSSDYCYIVTCGRDDFRYYDLVVEGKLVSRPL